MKYSRKALEDALETRLGVDYMSAWKSTRFCAIPEVCNQYAIKAFIFLEEFDPSRHEFTYKQRMADLVVATVIRELHDVGHYECGDVDDFVC